MQCVNVHLPLSSDWDGRRSSRQVVKSRETLFMCVCVCVCCRFVYNQSSRWGFRFPFVFSSSISFIHYLFFVPFATLAILSRFVSIIANVGRAHIPAKSGRRRKPPAGELFSFRWFCVFFFFFISSHVERSLTRQTFLVDRLHTHTHNVQYIYIHTHVCVCV